MTTSSSRRPMNHFTDKPGHHAIRSQPTWTFKAGKPRAKHNPVGAYFTNYPPDEPNLSVKIFVPKEKLQFMFSFSDADDLVPLPGGRGRERHIYYSRVDYFVERERQLFEGESKRYTAQDEHRTDRGEEEPASSRRQ